VRSTLALAAAALALAQGAAAERAPSPSACAVAWNQGARAQLRALIVQSRPRGAFIDPSLSIGTDRWTKAGGATSTSSRGCAIQFILRSGKILSVFGSWKAGTVSAWRGPVPSGRVIPVPDNARVHRDGTVGFHG
jgi:hypothetical protein